LVGLHHAAESRVAAISLRRGRVRIFKMSLDGHVIGWLGGEGKSLKEFG